MKIFMTVLMASIAWSSADVNELPASDHRTVQSSFRVAQQPPMIMQILRSPMLQHMHIQTQYQPQYQQQQQQPFRPSPLYQPSTQYLPTVPQQAQSSQVRYTQPILPQYQQQAQQPQHNSFQQPQYTSQLVQPLSQPQFNPLPQPQQTQQHEFSYQQIMSSPVPQPQLQPQQSQQQEVSYQQVMSQQVVSQPQPQHQQSLQHEVNYQQMMSSPVPQQQQLQQQEVNYQQLMSSPVPQLQQQKFSQKPSFALPMPSGLTVVPQFKTSRRLRPRVRIQIATKKPIISKSFFIHSAPEETEEDIEEELIQLSQQPRKHYNVLFVKTPSQTNKATAINFAKSLNEERTVVYVLSKKTSAADLKEALIDQPQILNKPEVFFIKYRTHEEAANAQRQIQAQYDSLGGSTTISDEGVAPVTSVVGSLDENEEEQEEEFDEEPQIQVQHQRQEHHEQQQTQLQQHNADQSQNNYSSVNNVNPQYLPPTRI